ncbi:MAG TPA: FAD:protein FMN transferase, partial [Candidatus Saccharimonadales bacterium]|nr:FAD:protein FMN transferase [Candidatus Saccharimonadales bacterium]
MPIAVEIIDTDCPPSLFEKVFSYFDSVDKRFSTYKENSEISKINRGEISPAEYSADMKTIFQLAEETKKQTQGYFNIIRHNKIDPSGIVKGWAIYQAAMLLSKEGVRNYYIEAGGDIQVSGKNEISEKWSVGIRNPFKQEEIVKVVFLKDEGIATSGTYIRGQHIYNPHKDDEEISDIMSITVIGPNIYEADRFATA